MKLELVRKEFTDISTVGDLLIDGAFFCYVLEDTDRQRRDGVIIPWTRDIKIPKETAIPYGHYEIITDHSNRFKKVMPLILHVPDFSGVRIHTGNTAKDTEGCLIIGYEKDENFVGQSVRAFGDFMEKLKSGLQDGKVQLTIRGE